MKKSHMKVVAAVLLSALAGSLLAGCGTTAGTNLKSYKDNITKILASMNSSSAKSASAGASSSASTSSDVVTLDTPTNFSVDGKGNYSFNGVDHADFYLIYFCDPQATGDDDDYLYASGSISEDGSGTYTGSCQDLFRYGYGEFLAKVYAFPAITDSSYGRSGAASQIYQVTGTQDEPVIDYFWNTNDGSLEIVLTNVDSYTYEVYPDDVVVNFIDVEDENDTLVVTMSDISPDNCRVTTDEIERDKTYNITAVANSQSAFVTNPTSELTTVAEEETFGNTNILSGGYAYSDGWATFPRFTDSFDLSGGNAGTVTGKFGAMEAASACQKTTTSAGSDYSYTLIVDFGGVVLDGTLELRSDGTLVYTENGGGPIAAGSISGSWVDLGDGKAALSYDPADITS